MVFSDSEAYDLFMHGLDKATFSGAAKFLKTLTNNFPVEFIPEHVKIKLLENAVKSDCPETVRVILTFTNAVTREIVKIADNKGTNRQ